MLEIGPNVDLDPENLPPSLPVKFFEKVVETAICGMYVYHVEDAKNEYINPQYTAITGWTKADLDAMSADTFAQLFHPEDQAAVFAHMQAIAEMKDQDVLEIEYRFKTKDNRWIWCLSRDALFDRNETGAVQRFMGTFVDITTQKENQNRMEAILQSTMDAVVVVDRQGKIVFWNSQAEAVFGYSVAEVLGQPMADTVIPKAFRKAHLEGMENYLKTGQSRILNTRLELFAQHKAGHDFPVELTVVELTGSQGIEFAAFIRDISIRKALELRQEKLNQELLHVNEALTQSNIELQQYAYIASHDLQTPLRQISGFAQLLQNTYQGQLTPKADDWIENMCSAVKRMQALITDLLQYAGIETRTQVFQPVDLNRLFSEIQGNNQPVIQENQAQIRTDSLPVVLGDQSLLFQLFDNLLSNSLKYRSSVSPVIEVRVQQHTDGHWLFKFKDNGMGISEKYLQQVFAVFQRLHSHAAYPGTGIGLAICRRVVQHHGGSIWIESKLNQGCTVCFKLPKIKAKRDAIEVNPF